MQKDEPGGGFAGLVSIRLLKSERHEMVEIAQVSGDEDCGWMRPAADIGIPHGEHLIPESLSLAGK